MHDHPERAPRSGLDAAVRIAAATVAMTVAAVCGAAILAVVVIATTDPVLLAIAAILALLAAGCVAVGFSKALRP